MFADKFPNQFASIVVDIYENSMISWEHYKIS